MTIGGLKEHFPWCNRDEIVDIPPICKTNLKAFYQHLNVDTGQNAQDERSMEDCPKTRPTEIPEITTLGSSVAFIDVVNSILDNLGVEKNIEFHAGRDIFLADRPTDTYAKPDIIAHRRALPPRKDGKYHWSSLEIAIKFHSPGHDREDLITQAATYATYLLEARPDLVSTLGLLVNEDDLVFIICNAHRVKKLELSEPEKFMSLLAAVVKYLNQGQSQARDWTLSRRMNDEDQVAFDLITPEKETYPACSFHYASDPFGRRVNIFFHKPGGKVSAQRVIKDQYIRDKGRWDERDILKITHKDKPYPAVVRMAFWCKLGHARCGNRIKVRMCFEDYGTSFMELDTPRKVLYAIYDLLEVTRSLYVDHGILHCDISPGNIVIRPQVLARGIETSPSASPVFIEHLLDNKGHKHESSILLIDFGYSRNLRASKPPEDGCTGTPVFIARAVRAGKPLPFYRVGLFIPLPTLVEGIHDTYSSIHPRRMKGFDGPYTVDILKKDAPADAPAWRHELCHDAESIIWVCFWWAIQAAPKGAPEERLHPLYWSSLLPSDDESQQEWQRRDDRWMLLHAFSSHDKVLHSGYGALGELFQNMAWGIDHDYHWAQDANRRKVEYVNELMQRLILNFVVENGDAEFMDWEKAREPRSLRRVYPYFEPEEEKEGDDGNSDDEDDEEDDDNDDEDHESGERVKDE